jgi:ubiquinone/menaquinone biosynthesis C-methylase UbiE
LHAYGATDAPIYDARRFASLRGKLIDHLEWRLLDRAAVVLAASVGPVAKVVDVPIGTGRMARRIRAHGCRVVGADASSDMLAVARGNDSADDYVVARVEMLSEAVAQADCVVSVRLFGHLPHEAKALALRQFRAVATKGALVFFAADSPWLSLRRVVQGARGRNFECWSPMTTKEARRLASEAGFLVLGVRGLLGPFSETHALILAAPDAVASR